MIQRGYKEHGCRSKSVWSDRTSSLSSSSRTVKGKRYPCQHAIIRGLRRWFYSKDSGIRTRLTLYLWVTAHNSCLSEEQGNNGSLQQLTTHNSQQRHGEFSSSAAQSARSNKTGSNSPSIFNLTFNCSSLLPLQTTS